MNRDTTQLKIIQYNVGRRYDSMAQLLRHPEIASVDFIAIQEPYIRKDIRATHNPTGGLFHVAMPPSEKRPRVCLYIHRDIDITKLRVHSYDSRDIISVTIEGTVLVAIHNIYNPHTEGGTPNQEYHGIPGNSVLPALDRALQTTNTYDQIVIGDFNLHHQMWAGPINNPSPTNHTSEFINTLTQHGLRQCLQVGTITRPADRAGSTGTTIDLVWATEDIRQRIRQCKTRPDLEADSDHIPIETTTKIETP
jgi:exonuclease III